MLMPASRLRRHVRWSPIPDAARAGLRPLSVTPVFPALLLFLAVTFSACSPPAGLPGEWVAASRVIDGDTLVLADGRRIRLLGLDAPEITGTDGEPECYAAEAKAFFEACLARTGGCVRLETDRVHTDRYARILAYLWDREGRMLNELILQEGYARFCAGDALRWRDRLAAAGAEARAHQRGLWHPGACGDPSGAGT